MGSKIAPELGQLEELQGQMRVPDLREVTGLPLSKNHTKKSIYTNELKPMGYNYIFFLSLI